MKKYINNADLEKNKKFEELNTLLENKLPLFCMDYFTGIAMRTSILTQLNYARDLIIFFNFLVTKINYFYGKSAIEIQLDDLNALESKDIEYFLRYLSYYSSNNSIRINGEKGKARKLSAIKSMLSYFYKNSRIQENVGIKVSTPKIHDKPIIRLDEDEVENILKVTESVEKFSTSFQNKYNIRNIKRDYAIITLLLGTGIRVSECVNLNLNDIDLKNNAFKVTRKGGNLVLLYFSDEIKASIIDYLPERENRLLKCDKINEEPALFLSLQNKRITARAVENLVKKYSEIVNPLKIISPHKLRSTYGTALYKKTKDIYVVAEVLGHKDVNTTKKHYAAISEDIKREASKQVTLRSPKNLNEK